ncbi:succinoglycan biosynthesis protein exoa [Thioclava sp. DLFJ4-1]|nr:succinoglycan biosynthesis protein exoa [Thioclava sp. DLFJ4-1]
MVSRILIVIPTLNESDHIASVISALLPFARAQDATVIVADGGSTDGTCAIVEKMAQETPQIVLLHNPDRLQAAAVNLAVERFDDEAEWLIRVDAHSAYPSDFCETLMNEAIDTGADSVVVRMHAEGVSPLQTQIARAQNSRFGNGGSAHRGAGEGRWVTHGHHALFRLNAFRSVGGYNTTFSHNEDAELDHRLIRAGFKIWLTARTFVRYFPRKSLRDLASQYFRFGKGRARTLALHRERPAMRQAIVAALAPALALVVLAPLHPIFALPAIVWLLGCAVAGLAIAIQTKRLANLTAGPIAGIMHLAWSTGFWAQILGNSMPTIGRGVPE